MYSNSNCWKGEVGADVILSFDCYWVLSVVFVIWRSVITEKCTCQVLRFPCMRRAFWKYHIQMKNDSKKLFLNMQSKHSTFNKVRNKSFWKVGYCPIQILTQSDFIRYPNLLSNIFLCFELSSRVFSSNFVGN